MSTDPSPPPGDGSQTLERGLSVLSELGHHPGGLSTSEVAVACGLHRSIAHRLLVSLHRTGYASRGPDGRYAVGPTVAGLLLADERPRLRLAAEPVLRRLAGSLDATASLVEVVGDAAVTTVVAESPTHGPRFTYRLGNRDPLDRGAGGLAALASGPPDREEPARVSEVRRAGYVATFAELNPGAYGVAVPLVGWGVRAALNVVTSREELVTEAVAPLVRAARELAGPAAGPA